MNPVAYTKKDSSNTLPLNHVAYSKRRAATLEPCGLYLKDSSNTLPLNHVAYTKRTAATPTP